MKLVVISPEDDHPRELAVLGELFAAGLERYHARKPTWSRAKLEAWLSEVPARWRARLVLHQHHALVETLGLGGVHWRDIPGTATVPGRSFETRPGTVGVPIFTSRSCHDLPTLRAALGHYNSVFFSPVFPSISKPGYGPHDDFPATDLASLLSQRSADQRRTAVLALGGVTAERLPEIRALGFDGIAVLGALWHSADPLREFATLQESLCCHAA